MRAIPYTTKGGAAQYKPACTADEFLENDCMGFCLACGSEAYNVEPDARRYTCETCQQPKVYGLQELMIMGLLVVESEEEHDMATDAMSADCF